MKRLSRKDSIKLCLDTAEKGLSAAKRWPSCLNDELYKLYGMRLVLLFFEADNAVAAVDKMVAELQALQVELAI